MSRSHIIRHTVRLVLFGLGCVLCLSGVTHADDPHPDLRSAVRLSTDAYTMKGQEQPAPYDREALTKLRGSTSVPSREIAELRLGVEELRTALQAKREEAQQAIIGGAAVAAPLVSASLIKNAISQLADGDDSLERQFSDGLGVVQSLEGLRQQVLEKQIAHALIGYSGQLADHQLRQKLTATITPRDAAAGINTGFTPSWSPRPEDGVEIFRVKNTTGKTLHNVLIVVDVGVNKQLYNENEAGQMAVLSGLSLLMGINPEQDNKFVLIRQAHGTVNRGGSAFVPEWPAEQSVEFAVSVIGMFAFRTESATLAIGADELAFTGRSLSIKPAVTAAQKRMESFQIKANQDAQKAARKRQLEAQKSRRR